MNNEYRGDSDLTTTEEQPEGSLDHCKPGRPDRTFQTSPRNKKHMPACLSSVTTSGCPLACLYTYFLCGEGQREGQQVCHEGVGF